MKRFHYNLTMNKQRGAALLVLAVVMILTVVILMVGKKSRNAAKSIHESTINARLIAAKEAIIAVAVTNNTIPGMLIYPDRRLGDNDFNGRGDCSNADAALPLNPQLLLGRLPFIDQQVGGGCVTVPAAPISVDVGQILRAPTDPLFATAPNQDPNPLHYAVSANLVQYTGGGGTITNTINSNVVNEPDVITAPSGWLTVYDENGSILSNRVAFIIFYPGPVLPGQNRTSPIATSAQFLDSINVPGIGLINNANPTSGNFVAAPESPTFNDKLVYVTADDLLRRVETRMFNLIVRTGLVTAPYPAVLPTAALITAQPLLTNWLSGGQNAYDQAIDTLTGGTGYNRTSITISNTQNCPGGPGASLRGVVLFQGVLQCLDLP